MMEPETIEELQKRIEELNGYINAAFAAIGDGPDVRIDEAVAAVVKERDEARSEAQRLREALMRVEAYQLGARLNSQQYADMMKEVRSALSGKEG